MDVVTKEWNLMGNGNLKQNGRRAFSITVWRGIGDHYNSYTNCSGMYVSIGDIFTTLFQRMEKNIKLLPRKKYRNEIMGKCFRAKN